MYENIAALYKIAFFPLPVWKYCGSWLHHLVSLLIWSHCGKTQHIWTYPYWISKKYELKWKYAVVEFLDLEAIVYIFRKRECLSDLGGIHKLLRGSPGLNTAITRLLSAYLSSLIDKETDDVYDPDSEILDALSGKKRYLAIDAFLNHKDKRQLVRSWGRSNMKKAALNLETIGFGTFCFFSRKRVT